MLILVIWLQKDHRLHNKALEVVAVVIQEMVVVVVALRLNQYRAQEQILVNGASQYKAQEQILVNGIQHITKKGSGLGDGKMDPLALEETRVLKEQ